MTRRRWQPTGDFKGYVNFNVDVQLRERIKAQKITLESLDDLLTTLSEAKYSVSFTDDPSNGCFKCSITCKDDKSPNYQYCLVGRGSTPVKAFKQAAFLHYQVFDGVWTQWTRQITAEIDD